MYQKPDFMDYYHLTNELFLDKHNLCYHYWYIWHELDGYGALHFSHLKNPVSRQNPVFWIDPKFITITIVSNHILVTHIPNNAHNMNLLRRWEKLNAV